jgi:serine protease inhibitor
MKITQTQKTLYLFLILIFSLCFMQCSRDFSVVPVQKPIRELSAGEKALVKSGESFGFKLFQEIANTQKDSNIFISPLSVSMALAMTYNGAAGSTEEAMQRTLGLEGLSRTQVNESFKSLIELLAGLDPKVQFDIANSIWYRQGYTVLPEFVSLNQSYFNAVVRAIDFDDAGAPGVINNWVDINTHGKITKIIDQIGRDVMMYLINAIYFKGTWTFEFKKELTVDDWFWRNESTQKPCRMMKQSNKFSYFENDNLQAVDLPYGDGQFSTTIILPKATTSIDALIASLDAVQWAEWSADFHNATGILYLPKFKLEWDLVLNDILKAMGMSIAFSGRADFSRMMQDVQLFISMVKHKTFLQVDEEGTEAAAVTVVEMSRTSVGDGPSAEFVMRVDRPFLFMIREHHSQTILFVGKIVEPVAAQ